MTSPQGPKKQQPGVGLYPTAEATSFIADVGGQRSYFPTDDAYCQSWFFPRYAGGKLHEPAASEFLVDSLTPESVFVDVGAHIGYFSILAAHTARAVFAIEAQESLIGRIHRNVVANHLTNVHTIMAAVGNSTGFVSMPKTATASTGVTTDRSGNLVPMLRLDDYFSGDLVPTHIKIDTEGFEYQVLQGMTEILKSKPILLLEVHHGMKKYGHSVGDMLNLLLGMGYAITPLQHRNAQGKASQISLQTILGRGNFMAICRPNDGVTPLSGPTLTAPKTHTAAAQDPADSHDN
jgi:FkbM family methyltransferase